MSACVIVEISDAENWAPRHGCKMIVDARRPTLLHPDRSTAESEAIRLARLYPGCRFAVFEAVAAGVTAKVPSHVNISGKVVRESTIAALADIDDDEVPF